MYYNALLYPLIIQVALTFAIMVYLFVQRMAEFQRKRINPEKVPTRAAMREQMTDSAPVADNFQNQFELPVLFYLGVVLALTLLLRDPVLAAFAWTFVTFRILHALVHVTYNNVMHRFYCFALSAIALLCLWLRLAWLIFIH